MRSISHGPQLQISKSREDHVRRLLLKYSEEIQAPNGCGISVITGKLRDTSIDEDGTIPQLIAGIIVIEWQNNPLGGNYTDSNSPPLS